MAASLIPCISTVSRGHLKEVMKIRKGGTEIAASSNPCNSTVSRDHLDENPKNSNERPRVFFAEMLKSRGRPEDGRKLDSLHFYGVRDHLDGSQNAAKKKVLS